MRRKAFLAVVLAITLSLMISGLAMAQAKHTVVAGDTLWLLSQRYGTTVTAIQQANGISGHTIYPGQDLTIPPTHRVVRGDTLWLLSQRYGTTVAAIQQANGISGYTIYPGQNLAVPQASSRAGGVRVHLQSWEMDLLARLISAEAQGEPYSGQVAVGAVVLNRMQSSSFPNTLYGVIYEVSGGYYQFCPVRVGSIHWPASASARSAARDAVQGWDPSNGALYFWNWRTVTNAWLWARPHTVTIGNHRFTR